jgi:hypothetical protein
MGLTRCRRAPRLRRDVVMREGGHETGRGSKPAIPLKYGDVGVEHLLEQS